MDNSHGLVEKQLRLEKIAGEACVVGTQTTETWHETRVVTNSTVNIDIVFLIFSKQKMFYLKPYFYENCFFTDRG